MPDESRLAGVVIADGAVRGGRRQRIRADLRSGQRRFFQYQYTLRIINPDAIGTGRAAPDHRRFTTGSTAGSPANAALQGRDLTYVLPPQSVRVAVDGAGRRAPISATRPARASRRRGADAPGGRSRDRGASTLRRARRADDARRRSSRLARRVAHGRPRPASGCWATRAIARRRRRASWRPSQRERERQGWTEALVGRALAATRIAARLRARPAPSASGQRRRRGAERRRGARSIAPAVSPRQAATRCRAPSTTEDLARRSRRLPAPPSRAAQQLEELRGALADVLRGAVRARRRRSIGPRSTQRCRAPRSAARRASGPSTSGRSRSCAGWIGAPAAVEQRA